MKTESLVQQLFQHLVSGRRAKATEFVSGLRETGLSAEALANDIFWPLHEMLVKLHKHGQLARLHYNYATRLLRQIAHTSATAYTRGPARTERVLMFCGPTEGEELGAQLAVDLLESSGFEVYFGGAGVANDEVLGELNDLRPNFLVMWASAAQDAPAIRQLIDTVREINGHPGMKIVCGGGVFNRAPGLSEEIGAAATASTPASLVTTLVNINQAKDTRTAKGARSGSTVVETKGGIGVGGANSSSTSAGAKSATRRRAVT
ncbi:MAG: cobalamin-dependent protein [Phycisphaerae bacterium]|nr:cobalamin-dependent protein [Phycisphaerae bacterium]